MSRVRTGRPARATRPVVGVAVVLLSGLALGGCADLPAAPEPDEAGAQGLFAAVAPDQAEQVRAQVADRLLAAREAGDPALVDTAATGPAAELDRLGVRLDGPVADAAAEVPAPATVLVSPQVEGWPRWFLAVTDPASAPTPSGGASTEPSVEASTEPSVGASTEPSAPVASLAAGDLPSAAPSTDVAEEPAVVAALPELELFVADDVRQPYRSWGRLTMLPGAEIPAIASAEVGAPSFDLPATDPDGEPSSDPSASVAPSPAPSAGAEDDDGLRTAVTDLAARYASVMTDGDASDAAAEFEPDPFVSAVRARAEAETAAVADVASTTVVHEPFEGGPVLFAARTVDGDVLAVTAVQSTTTMTVRPGEGVLRPGREIRAVAGIEETNGTLTTRSVAALAFLVPAEQGAIRLVAVGEGLVAAEAS